MGGIIIMAEMAVILTWLATSNKGDAYMVCNLWLLHGD